MLCRDLNAATSQEVFVGPYLDNPEEREKFSAAFMDMTQGFLAFPLCLPGTAVWKGKQGRLYIIAVLMKAAARSKLAMQVFSCTKDCAHIGIYHPGFQMPERVLASCTSFLGPGHCGLHISLLCVFSSWAQHPHGSHSLDWCCGAGWR